MSVYDDFSVHKAEAARDDAERDEDRLMTAAMRCPDIYAPEGERCPFDVSLYTTKEKAAFTLFQHLPVLARMANEEASDAESRIQQRIDELGSDEWADRDGVRLSMELARIRRARKMLNWTSGRIKEALQQTDGLRHPDVKRRY